MDKSIDLVSQRGRGRIPKYTPELRDEICKYILEGNSYEDAAVLSGVSYETIKRWRRPQSKQYHEDFSIKINEARVNCKSKNINLVQKAAIKTWQAAAWWLERRYHNEYALKTINEHGGKDGQPISFTVIGGGYIPQDVKTITASNGHSLQSGGEVQDAGVA